MKLSIITVNYNHREGLKNTIASVGNQTVKPFEYIVIDGASTDGSLDVILSNQDIVSVYLSEPDNGIYQAMNKGINLAHGDYCLFLNSGDTLYAPTTLEELSHLQCSSDYIQGTIHFAGTSRYEKAPSNISASFYLYGRNNFHQASLISRTLLLKFPYDETLKIASDLKFNIQTLVIGNVSYTPINTVISTYEMGGRSQTITHDEEKCLIYRSFFSDRVLQDYIKFEPLYTFPAQYIAPLLMHRGLWELMIRIRDFMKIHLLKRQMIKDSTLASILNTPQNEQ